MSSESPIEELFSRVAGIADPEERSAFLRKVCGEDSALRRQVEALLASHADSHLGTPLFHRQGVSAAGEIGERAGDRLGPYVLGERLGEGSFGVVFAAEQQSPIRRRVAVKILKPGMDARQIVLRFEQERQTLALMDHPHIARVFDAGATGLGRPFFVMEFARGEPITAFCDRHRLNVRDRLQLFTKVCRAVHHAHQKGIIHRDLKPSNITADFEEGEARPKVIDFGIAKAVHGKLIEETFHTAEQQLLGTPAYMSPEQALPGVQGVDTRSDVYSLGVVLYELLSGVIPIEMPPGSDAQRWRELICESPISKPSTRVGQLPVTVAARVAADRAVKPIDLSRMIGRDLDWIVLKATDKELNQRYASAEALARDIERFLENRPIEARSPSPIYLATRFIRRHRLLVGSAAAVAMAVIAGAAAAAWGWQVAARESRIASAENRKAQQLNDILFLGLLRSDPGQGKGKAYTVREFLDDLGRDVDGRREMTPDVECGLRDMLSFIYRETGEYQQALHHGLRGLTLAREQKNDPRRLASFLMTLGEVSKELDDYDQAARYLDECLTIRRGIFGENHPEVIRTILTTARVHYKQGDRATGLTMASEALSGARLQADRPWGKSQLIRCLNMTEMLLRDEGRYAESASLNRERLELTRSERGENHSDTFLARTHLGSALTQMNRLDEAREILTSNLQSARAQLGDQYPLTLETMVALAECHARLGNVEQAAALYDEAISHAGAGFSMELPDRRDWIERAIRFHEEHGRTRRARELRELLDSPPDKLWTVEP